jgi:hypothetical protein
LHSNAWNKVEKNRLGVFEKCAEEDIWAYIGGGNRGLKKLHENLP